MLDGTAPFQQSCLGTVPFKDAHIHATRLYTAQVGLQLTQLPRTVKHIHPSVIIEKQGCVMKVWRA